MGNKAIYTFINGRKTFVGKQINDVIHREFDFSKAVLWQNKELSFDERLLLYAQNQKIKSFVFTDIRKKTSFKFGLKKILNNGRFDQHGVGARNASTHMTVEIHQTFMIEYLGTLGNLGLKSVYR